jgi:translation initiation factor IF-1
MAGIDGRAQQLREEESENERIANVVLANADAVQGAIDLVNLEAGNSRKWREIEERVRARGEAGDVVAVLVVGFDLENGKVTLRLPASPRDDDDDDDDEGAQDSSDVIDVAVKIGKSAMANARDFFQVTCGAFMSSFCPQNTEIVNPMFFNLRYERCQHTGLPWLFSRP